MNPMTRSNRVGDLGGGQGAASEELGIWDSEVSSLAHPFDSTQASCGSISIFSFEIFRSGASSGGGSDRRNRRQQLAAFACGRRLQSDRQLLLGRDEGVRCDQGQ